MTSHELAKLLLEGPNLPIFIQDEFILPVEAGPRPERVCEHLNVIGGFYVVDADPTRKHYKPIIDALILVGD